MRDGFDLGVRVMPRVRRSTWIEGTLSASPGHRYEPGWKNLAYSGDGWYFVRWDWDDRVWVVREDEIEVSEVTRYVVTNLMVVPLGSEFGGPPSVTELDDPRIKTENRSIIRTLTFAAQGQYTYATKEEAQKQLELFKPGLHAKILGKRADTLEVRACKCWPGHFDPRGIYFDLGKDDT